jgi:hypothetical protein
MEVVENKTASNETVVLDDKSFVGCRFRDCKLVYGGGEFTAIDTKFENCQVALAGQAQRIAAVLSGFGILKPPAGPALPSKSSVQ